jgi:prepilin-type N-terminal cleavage/methylation domain-containing protein
MRNPRSPVRPGMTIIEVLFAIVILSGVMLSLSRFGQSFTRATADAANLTLASDLATARLEAIKGHANYLTMVTTFNGTSETSGSALANPSMQGYTGFTRATQAVRTQNATSDYVTVTVTVSAAVLKRPVGKTVRIARFR